MRLPSGPVGSPAEGKPTLSTSRIRSYGAAGMTMDDQEAVAGCPRLYKARWVDRSVPDTRAENLIYGSAVHDALYRMEAEPIGPDEALARAWPSELGPERLAEAKRDLERYLERGGPSTKYATLGVEVDLYAPLYDDPEFGEVWYSGRIDHLGVDLEDTSTLHVTDYKTNRFPPSRDAVKNDVQMQAYSWLTLRNAERWLPGKANVVVHYDPIKWYEIEWRYDDETLAVWHEWASAIARRILRDDRATPRVNPGCGWCPVKLNCPAYKKLSGPPEMLDVGVSSIDELVRWREKAAETRKVLDAGIRSADTAIEAYVANRGPVDVDGTMLELDSAWTSVVDTREAHRLLGQTFYDIAKLTKSAVEERVHDPGLREAVLKLWQRMPSGTRLKRSRVKS